MNKQHYKRRCGACAICGENTYELLDVHRIQEGGIYYPGNTVVLCVTCHRKHHAGLIDIQSKHFSSDGWILIYTEMGVEHVKKI